jgi:hypothetical protein
MIFLDKGGVFYGLVRWLFTYQLVRCYFRARGVRGTEVRYPWGLCISRFIYQISDSYGVYGDWGSRTVDIPNKCQRLESSAHSRVRRPGGSGGKRVAAKHYQIDERKQSSIHSSPNACYVYWTTLEARDTKEFILACQDLRQHSFRNFNISSKTRPPKLKKSGGVYIEVLLVMPGHCL